MVFKCKMCGGTLELNNENFAICGYCGSKQTLPKLNNDRKTNLYERANHFRRNNEFDKAISIYEQLLTEDNTDAETYWSLVLCRYGVEYVEDPVSKRRIPTVNRSQFTSVFNDEDYKSVLKYADASQKEIYESEASAINEIQKNILAISSREEPFDVFICYKESDENGQRTPDSVIATELYHELIRTGYKVFFSRITLENKLGTAYEPYIFAALNSSKVMVVLGTKPEHFNAVWVKNEWSRYLTLIKNGARKILIPAYKNMNPYYLPEEFSHLQAQDMSKLGFMQDLIHGINKIVQLETPKETVVDSTALNISALLERAFIFLEDGKWDSADEYCEKVLDNNPKEARAYLCKMMIQLRIRTQEEFKNCKEPINQNENYLKIMKYGNDSLKSTIESYDQQIEDNILNLKYKAAFSLFNSAHTIQDYANAYNAFIALDNYKNSAQMAEKCHFNATDIKYNEAKALLKVAKTSEDFIKAAERFAQLGSHRDSAELAQKSNFDAIDVKYREAISLMHTAVTTEDFKNSAEYFDKLGSHRNSAELAQKCRHDAEDIKYNNAMSLLHSSKTADDYKKAFNHLEELGTYRDSAELIEKFKSKLTKEKKERKKLNLRLLCITATSFIVILVIEVILFILLDSSINNELDAASNLVVELFSGIFITLFITIFNSGLPAFFALLAWVVNTFKTKRIGKSLKITSIIICAIYLSFSSLLLLIAFVPDSTSTANSESVLYIIDFVIGFILNIILLVFSIKIRTPRQIT